MRFSIVQMDMFLMVYIVTNLFIAGGAQIFPYRKQRVENGQNIAGFSLEPFSKFAIVKLVENNR